MAEGLAAIPGVVQVRGEGLLLGAVLKPGRDAKAIVRTALDRGLVVNAPVPGVIRLAPPLNVSDAEIDQALAILRQILEEPT